MLFIEVIILSVINYLCGWFVECMSMPRISKCIICII